MKYNYLSIRCAPLLIGTTMAISMLPGNAQQGDVQMSPISGDPNSPRRHYRLRDPADLGHEEGNAIYEIVRGALAKGYAVSGLEFAQSYFKNNV